MTRFPILAAGLALAAGCSTGPAGADRETLHQYAVFNGLMQGQYDGALRVDDLLTRGDFGIGTFDRLDGEMVVLDGVCYQVKSDGSVARVPPDRTTPFAAVTRFDEDLAIEVTRPVSLPELQRLIDERLPGPNAFYAVRVTGRFSGVRARSVPRQEPPYKPLAEVVANQAVFELAAGPGDLVGFRCPAYTQGVSVPGYHFHFLDAARGAGGHVMAAVLESGRVSVDRTDAFRLSLPGTIDFLRADLTRTSPDAFRKVEAGGR